MRLTPEQIADMYRRNPEFRAGKIRMEIAMPEGAGKPHFGEVMWIDGRPMVCGEGIKADGQGERQWTVYAMTLPEAEFVRLKDIQTCRPSRVRAALDSFMRWCSKVQNIAAFWRKNKKGG